MSFLGRVFRFLFWVLILSWVVKLLGRAISGWEEQARGDNPDHRNGAAGTQAAINGKRLVKDPVCGMHIAEELALPVTANGETHYFCSPECRAKFVSSMVQRASA
jgi:YHS domain-containing protein